MDIKGVVDKSAKFSFKVPDDAVIQGTKDAHPDAGKKIERSFDYQECENEEAANAVATEKGWTLLQFVNEALKANARSSAYQTALAVYKPSEVSAEDIKARMIRDFVRSGLTEEMAKNVVEAALAAK